MVRHDGVELPTSQVIIAHRTPSGEVDHFSAIIRDITPLKRAETLLDVGRIRSSWFGRGS